VIVSAVTCIHSDVFIDCVLTANKTVIISHSSTSLVVAAWVPDSQSKSCQLCRSSWSFSNRRHHCRSCGALVCQSCSSRNAIIPDQLKNQPKPVRVCDGCFDFIRDSRLAGPRSPTSTSSLSSSTWTPMSPAAITTTTPSNDASSSTGVPMEPSSSASLALTPRSAGPRDSHAHHVTTPTTTITIGSEVTTPAASTSSGLFSPSTIDDYDGTQQHDAMGSDSDDDNRTPSVRARISVTGVSTTPRLEEPELNRQSSSGGSSSSGIRTDGSPVSGSPQVGTLHMGSSGIIGRSTSSSFSAGLSRPSAAAARHHRGSNAMDTTLPIPSSVVSSSRAGSGRRPTVAGVVTPINNTSTIGGLSTPPSTTGLSSGYYTTQPVNAAIDMYGFLKTGDVYIRNVDTEVPSYRVQVEKQREKWNTYLALHPSVVRSPGTFDDLQL
jgi:hypothetical protein